MFVCGMIADLEFSLRATAVATEKATFGVNSAQRADRAAKRLEAAQGKLDQPLLSEVLTVYKSVKLKLNNKEELLAAANKIAALGIRFAATVDGNSLEPVHKYIPSADRWK
jgi:predicted TIM-barrel fold metal-dependent hydrolase